jgi:drug/metabolite transporter (DMT)-like permease
VQEMIGLIFVLLAGFGFGFLGIFGRYAFQSGLSVGELLTYRFVLASLLLWMGLFVFKRDYIKLPLKQVLISVSLGVFGYAVFSTLYFKSIEGISVPLAALLLFTFPIFVNLGAYFFLKEKMTKNQIISLVLATVGLGILLWGPLVVNSPAAVIYALVAAVTYSIYVLVSGRVQQNVAPLSSSLYVISASALALYLFHQPSATRLTQLTSQQLFIISGIAVVSTIAPLTLFLAGLQRLSSSKASIVVMIEPVVATIAAFFFLGEKLSLIQISGAILVLVALVFNAKK